MNRVAIASSVAFALHLLAVAGGVVPPSAWSLPAGARLHGDILEVSCKDFGSSLPTTVFDLRPYAGKCIRAKIRVSGENLMPGAKGWLGYKFMFSFRDARSGDTLWLSAPCETGTFGWRDSTLDCDLRGRDPEAANLTLGIQESSGVVRFDLASLEIEEIVPLFPDDDSDGKVRYSERMRRKHVCRGVMLPAKDLSEDDFKTLHEWGANSARFQIMRGWTKIRDNQDVDEYRHWVNSRVDHLLGKVLPLAERYGIDIVVDLHVAPGGVDANSDMVMFHESKYAEAFVAVWQDIARRCLGQRRIMGYDLINEPCQSLPSEIGVDYLSLQERAARAVREIDGNTPIIVESNLAASPQAFSYLKPLDMEDVAYQLHMYGPMEYTHQGVHASAPSDYRPVGYPNRDKGWGKEGLRSMLAPVRDFQMRHKARIYVGEFSAVAWAEGADRYIADCIELFEEYGWDWSYHAFREWHGWDVEREAIGRMQTSPSQNGLRKKALLDGLGLNQKNKRKD